MPKAVVSGGVLSGKAVTKPQPAYPAVAKAGRVQGTVTVQVVVDETGQIISVRAVSGHPLLQASAVAAARRAHFAPTMLSGKPVKVTGILTYNFDLSGNATSAGELESAAPSDPAEQKRQEFLKRLHPQVAALVERLRDGKETPGEAEAKFVREGRAELRIWLTEKSPAVLAQLKELGFELILDAQSSNLVIGRLPVEKIAALADIQAVRFVAPQTN
jgi:TonB family protein